MTTVRAARPGDEQSCVDVLAALPEFFTPDTHDKFRSEMPQGRAWVAVDGHDAVCGFVQVMRRYPKAAEITYLAVLSSLHRRGIGRALVADALAALEADGVAVVEAKTLDASSDYAPYVATRAFWETQGFVQIDMIDPLPGWQPGNPSAIYVAGLARTVPRDNA